MRKNGFKHKLNILRKNNGRSYTVAVMGVSSGVGVTHSVLYLANYLRRCRLKVAVVELNQQHHFREIEGAYEGIGFNPASTESFRIKGVHYYKSMSRESMLSLYQQGYDVILLDIGWRMAALIDDIQLADLPLVVARMSDWKRHEIDAFIAKYGHVLPKRSQWLLVHGDLKDKKAFENHHHYKSHCLVNASDPFAKDRTYDACLEALFE